MSKQNKALAPSEAAQAREGTMSRDIPVSEIRPNPRQPRKHFDGLAELAVSLKAQGQLTPILVRPVAGGYELVHGERRWQAAQLAGLQTLRAEVREMTEAEAYHLAVVENLQRADLTPLEEAEAYRALLDEGMTQAQVGELVGKTQSYVAQKLRLLKAPAPVRALVAKGALSEGHTRQLLRFEGLYPAGKALHLSALVGTQQYERTPRYLLGAYNVWRPEDNPAVPLWIFPEEWLAACPHKDTLYDSLEALLAYAEEPGGAAPQWVVAAWWWGAACVVFDIPVAVLARGIDNWWERFQSAVWYMSIYPGPEERGSTPDDKALWWGMYADLRHGNCLPVTRDDFAHVMSRDTAGGHDIWVFPTALQPWGTNRAAGERLEERDIAQAEAATLQEESYIWEE